MTEPGLPNRGELPSLSDAYEPKVADERRGGELRLSETREG
jgi:hypothetical protein